MTDKLKPCPFCGGEAELIIDEACYYKSQVYCKKCGVRTNRQHIPEIAVTTWNTRKPTDKVVKQLEENADYEPVDFDYGDVACTAEQRFIALEDAIEIVKGGVG